MTFEDLTRMPLACASSIARALRRALPALAVATACAAALGPAPAAAQAIRAPLNIQPLVIRDDAGGRVDWRAEKIAKLRQSGQPVQLRGECMSACTMYLSLPQVCVAANATFGFHGPSFYGIPLNDYDFNYWSQVIAAHYPAPIAEWFMTEARYSTNRTRRIRGSELIRMGIPECGSAA
ncbi:hypothetical protein GVY41_05535 [Frigidibacter albus]|uniref:Uncharacterized protein n=1 Tax=Frigidibacter albus TaxID=1465486 RepID=A0A6L8VEY0_9RHOB|nr:hypothetical protein [Frigidibacter albus]MZQ88724.1 hypothetical protein [Frigidibacter albus]NBE30467.1 hypothetical protein [Frigidibacter albus]GGH50100.1 hypothetical protein GCM10011341_12850 [Frigidibacter albus]